MIYRVAKNVGDGQFAAATTSRPPGNVPYYVDNIWEWLRPDGAASRRRAAFASPTPELAASGAQGDVSDAWCVELVGDQKAFQIIKGEHPHDARYHTDISKLKNLILKDFLGKSWFDLPLTQRRSELDLFAPCLSKSDVNHILNDSSRIDVKKIIAACTFWQDVAAFDPVEDPLHPTGEIFFEGAYNLSKIK